MQFLKFVIIGGLTHTKIATIPSLSRYFNLLKLSSIFLNVLAL